MYLNTPNIKSTCVPNAQPPIITPIVNQSTTMSITASMREGKTRPDFDRMWTPGEPDFEPPPER